MTLRWQMAPTFARAMWHAALYVWAGKPLIVPRQVSAYRRGVCGDCPKNNHAPWPNCEACSCFIEPKILLSSESCPIDRWPALGEKKDAPGSGASLD